MDFKAHNSLVFLQIKISEGIAFCTGFCIEHKKKKYIITCSHCSGYDFIVRTVLSDDGFKGKFIIDSITDDLMLLESDVCNLLTPIKISTKIPNIGDKLFHWGFQSYDRGFIGSSVGRMRSIVTIEDPIPFFEIDSFVYQSTSMIIPGDSGGPVLNKDNELVGINSYFQNNLFYSISNIIITNFLDKRLELAINKNIYYTNPDLFISDEYQYLNKSLKKLFNYKGNGVLIRNLSHSVYNNIFRVNDILVSINNISINDHGFLKLKEVNDTANELFIISLYRYIHSYFGLYDNITVKIFRDKKFIDINVKLEPNGLPYYKNRFNYNAYKWCGMYFKYYILSDHYGVTHSFDKNFHNAEVLATPKSKLIIISDIIYSEHLQIDPVQYTKKFIKSVNDVLILNLEHLIKVLNTKSEIYKILLYSNQLIVIYASDIKKLNEKIYFSEK